MSSAESGQRNRLNYIQTLALAHSKLTALPVELAPSSRPPSPRSSSHSELLKEKISEAVAASGFDVTHPKWSHVSSLVKMACTSRGYRGAASGVSVGTLTTVDVGNYDWLLPETEEGWKRCERKWETRLTEKKNGVVSTRSKYWEHQTENNEGAALPSKKDLVREKVESWKAKIVQDEGEDTHALNDKRRDLLQQSEGGPSGSQLPLDFQVVKRPTLPAAHKSASKDTSKNRPGTRNGEQMHQQVHQPRDNAIPRLDLSQSGVPVPTNISDLSEMVCLVYEIAAKHSSLIIFLVISPSIISERPADVYTPTSSSAQTPLGSGETCAHLSSAIPLILASVTAPFTITFTRSQ